MPYPTINRVVLLGRLTSDPDLRELPSGETICVLRIACNTYRNDGQGGYREKPNFFDVDVFGALGENVALHMRKGSRVGIDGRLDWREWKNSFQEKREAVSIVADTVQFLDGAGGRRPGQSQLELVGAGVGADAVESDLAF
jgi:single-strand DNA-binding protein